MHLIRRKAEVVGVEVEVEVGRLRAGVRTFDEMVATVFEICHIMIHPVIKERRGMY